VNNQSKIKRILLSTAALLLLPVHAMSWGPDGHHIVGAISLDYLDRKTLTALHELLGTDDPDEIVQWCNWPDEYRSTDEGAWTYPKHFINMVPGESLYVMERDCPTGLCVTEAIGEYARELGNLELSLEKPRQAYGFVCHFVGDIHQPLHAGFGHDRGGNDVDVIFNGEKINVHSFWDSALISDRSESWQGLYDLLSERTGPNPAADWQSDEVISWTNESHEFAGKYSYPGTDEISDAFADRSWKLAKEQLRKGGYRLARVLNTVLKPAGVDASTTQTPQGKNHCHRKDRS